MSSSLYIHLLKLMESQERSDDLYLKRYQPDYVLQCLSVPEGMQFQNDFILLSSWDH